MKKKITFTLAGMLISFLTIQAQPIEEIQQLFANDGAIEDYFGSAISISGDYAIVGACYDDDNGTNAGAAYIYYNNSGIWEQQAKLIASDGSSNDFFALTVAISGDYAFAGAIGDDSYTGSVYVFHNNSGTWSQTDKLTASDAAEYDIFSNSISISGDYAVVGASGDDDNEDGSGSAYIFYNNSGTWEQQAKLNASDPMASDQFGTSVGISGDNVIVGASFKDDNGTNSGACYVFQNNSGTWSQIAKLNASDASAYDYFGNAVSISDDYAVIGAYSDCPNNITGAGSVYVFHNNSGVWEQQSKHIASDAYSHGWFGTSVSISGDSFTVGGKGEISFTPYVAGSAYIFHNNSGIWSEAAILVSSDIGIEDEFGYAVGISGDVVIVGAPRNDTNGEDVGSAYIYCAYFPEITTQPISQEDVTLGTDITFSVVAEGTNLTYQWRKDEVNLSNGGNISGATTNELLLTSVTAYDIGTYDCRITNACGTISSDNAILSIITGINDPSEHEISIYPNPTTGIINFEFASNNVQQIRISDLTGKTIIEKVDVLQNETIELTGFESGIYIISIQTEKGITTSKIIVE